MTSQSLFQSALVMISAVAISACSGHHSDSNKDNQDKDKREKNARANNLAASKEAVTLLLVVEKRVDSLTEDDAVFRNQFKAVTVEVNYNKGQWPVMATGSDIVVTLAGKSKERVFSAPYDSEKATADKGLPLNEVDGNGKPVNYSPYTVVVRTNENGQKLGVLIYQDADYSFTGPITAFFFNQKEDGTYEPAGDIYGDEFRTIEEQALFNHGAGEARHRKAEFQSGRAMDKCQDNGCKK